MNRNLVIINNNQAGFTLVELLIASLLMGIMCVGMGFYVHQAYLKQGASHEKSIYIYAEQLRGELKRDFERARVVLNPVTPADNNPVECAGNNNCLGFANTNDSYIYSINGVGEFIRTHSNADGDTSKNLLGSWTGGKVKVSNLKVTRGIDVNIDGVLSVREKNMLTIDFKLKHLENGALLYEKSFIIEGLINAVAGGR
jgi:prepilin-type N-terminal cleavage/methylation domain-containing protein